MPYDANLNAEAVLPEGVTAEMLDTFCKEYGFWFHAVGHPDDWKDTESFRVGTHRVPSVGHTVKFAKVIEWKAAIDSIGERVYEGGTYRHYQGDTVTTICRAEGNMIGYRHESGRNYFVEIGDFFTIVNNDGVLVAKFSHVPAQALA
ncbi:hypothetical protein RYA05_02205 [Pseudomonas syringae pv. actinidiae]|nr:hypothetical protein [Pseudomonas syringae pv. actinidiae]